MAYDTELAQADTALGNDNPTLAYNLDTYADFAPVSQFLDVVKHMRRWEGNLEDGSGKINYATLADAGYLDKDGWVKELPEGVSSIFGFWQWANRSRLDMAEDASGVYVLEYEGTGEIVLAGGARLISSEPGRIVFEQMAGDNLYMSLRSTDPEKTGDYVRNISIVAEKHLPLYEAGAVYNPAWLELIEDARELRFMNWSGTNNASEVSWEERSVPEGLFWGTGVPVEYMVKLANEVGADPWFTMPHTADEEFIRNVATYVRDNLDPGLKAKVEYSNETWNWAFDQTEWLYNKAQEEWGVQGGQSQYYVKKSVETALIWEDVFGSEADDRLVNVLATQTGNLWLTERMLKAETWKQFEPDAFVDPATVFEELAVTTYFGNATVSNSALRAELIAAIKNPDVDAATWLADKLMDPEYRFSIPQIADSLARNAALVEEYGLKLSAYEGGQHVHHAFSVRDLTQEDIEAMQDFMVDFVRSEEMGQLYRELWDVWAEYGDGPFMNYGDVGTPNKWGSWSLYAGLEDSTPRSEAIEELNRDTGAWWEDDRDGSQFQQGLINNGSAVDDLLMGTAKSDYLLGMDGNDILVAGQGDDGLNGGNGVDRAVFAGAFSDYTVRAEGEGYRIEGPDGSDFLINVEEIAFASEQVIVLSDLIATEDGKLTLDGLNPTETPPAPAPIVPGMLFEGQIKDGADHEKVTINDLSDTNNGIIIKTIWASSKIAQHLDLGAPKETPSYLTYAKGAYEFSDLVQLTSAALVETGQTAFDISDAAIVTQAVKIVATNGDDSFYGGQADDVASGAGGDDYMIGASGNDTLYGNAGDDRLIGNAGDDSLNGGDGNDHIDGGQGRDLIDGGAGDDKIFAGQGDDVVHGKAGNDRIAGGDGADQIFGGAGNDVIEGGDGNDYIIAESGNDKLYGNDGDDRLIGQSGNNTLDGGAGRDHVDGGHDNDIIFGGTGEDKIYGHKGDDVIYGEDDNDLISGGEGDDTLYGNENDDILKGEIGDDRLFGGQGNDLLIGGAGKDQFVFDIGDGDDQITDFAREDSLDLTGFLLADQTLEDAASMENGNLVLSNGDDRITLLGLETEDLSWMSIDM